MNYQFNFKFLDFVEVIFLIFIENKILYNKDYKWYFL